MATTVSPLKILSDLGMNPWEIENDEDYLRALKEGIITIEAASKGKGDRRSEILRDELIRVRKERKAAPTTEVGVKEKKTTIKGTKLLPGTTFRPQDIKPVDVDDKKADAPALMPDRLESIANTVDSIALLLRRQFGLEKKQQRDNRKKQNKINKDARENKLEGKPKDKKTGLIPSSIAKPTLGFFGRIQKFFTNIAIGSALVSLLKWIKDPANAEKVTKFKDFLINNAPLILGGLAALALLPIVGSLVGLIGGIMGGLSMLGLAVPLLPIILKGILIAAVLALTVAAGNAIKNKLTQAISGGGKFEELDQKGRDDLLEAGINQGGTLVDEKGKALKIPAGENRRGDTIFKMGVVDPSMTDDIADARGIATQSQVIAHIGQEEYDKKVAALSKWKNLMGEKDPIKKQMGDELEVLPGQARRKIIDERADSQELADIKAMPSGFGKREQNAARTKALKEYENETARLAKEAQLAEEKRIREKYDKIIMEKFSEYFDTSADINTQSSNDGSKSSDLISKNLSGSKNIILNTGSTSSSGGTVVNGGGASSQNLAFSSTDPNNSHTLSAALVYNMSNAGAVG